MAAGGELFLFLNSAALLRVLLLCFAWLVATSGCMLQDLSVKFRRHRLLQQDACIAVRESASTAAQWAGRRRNARMVAGSNPALAFRRRNSFGARAKCCMPLCSSTEQLFSLNTAAALFVSGNFICNGKDAVINAGSDDPPQMTSRSRVSCQSSSAAS